ncbi:MAG: hypothetical protein JW745_00065 [Sedimentisphaerales bacterium]|nr:hypothetical protein [Sedimentisphaerales bacterium]MBN2842420.1 hypothetical protein [Sedimentisphaerales bacterium]
MKIHFRQLIIALIMTLTTGSAVCAVGTTADQPAQSDKFVELSISGAAEPVPALQYRLLPPRAELKPGNAAIDWFKLTASMTSDETIRERLNLKEGDPDCSELLSMPFAKFKSEYLDYADKYYKVSTWDFLRHAALREICDWQDPLEDGVNMLLPSLSDFKKIARYVALEARVEIAKGNYQQALKLLSYNFSLAEDLGHGKTIIQNLVGIGVAWLSYEVVKDMVCQPDCPNLYWALELIPDSLVDMRIAYAAEMDLWFKSNTDMLEDSVLSVEQAHKIMSDMFQLNEGSGINNVALTAYVGMNYIPAKKKLLESGYEQSRLDIMPSVQVVILSMWKEYLPVRDNVFKYLFLPYYQGHDLVAQQEKELADIMRANGTPNLFYGMLPAVSKTSRQQAMLQVRGAALQCVEAIRMYAAENGKLPEKLSDIINFPTPINVFTGKEFKYYLDGETGVLDVEEPVGVNKFSGYKISLRK